MDSWVSNFFCCNSKNDALEPSTSISSITSSFTQQPSCSCDTSSSNTVGLFSSENSLTSFTESLELRECKPKSTIKITILPLASDDPKTSRPSLGPQHLHYSSVICDEDESSQGSSLTSIQELVCEEDYNKNYGDSIIASRPSFACTKKSWPSSFSSTSTPLTLTHEDMNLLDKLQKARYDSNRKLPPLPKSPKHSNYINTNSSNYNKCKTYFG